MLNFFLADRVKELSRTIGTGPLALDGAADGFSGFDDIFASGDTVFYAVTDNDKYEVGSGIYEKNGSNRSLTRFVIRSSNLNIGPYYVDGTSNRGPTDGQNGNFHPLWLSRSAAVSGVGFGDGPYSGPVSGISFDEFPGQTFYYVPEHFGSGEVSHPALSGVDFNASGSPVNFLNDGVKEVFVTYPGKTSVYNAYGVDPNVYEPQRSGIAFWENEQVINYASGLFWDNDSDALGVRKHNPTYAIDVGGDIDFSVVRASGFVDGGSGVLFSGVVGSYSGGRQLEPFMRNELNNETGSDAVLELSGVVDQGIMFKKQLPRTFFVGPSGECGCVDDYPVFRELVASDLDPIVGDLDFVTQNNVGVGSNSEYPFVVGQVAVYRASGEITYDSGLYYDANNNRLGINGVTDGYLVPEYVLHVSGDMAAQSGTFDQILFTDNIARIGEGAGSYLDNLFVVNIGYNAGVNSSGVEDGIIVGSGAGNDIKDSDKVVVIGRSAGASARYTDSVIAVGSQAAENASGLYNITVIGSGAGWGASQVDKSFIGGPFAGSGLEEADSVVAIGENALADASGVTSSVAIGTEVAEGSSGVLESNLIGDGAASGSFDLGQVNAIGEKVAVEATGLTKSSFIGQAAGRYAETLDNVVAIGQFAAQSGLQLERTVAVGALAASQASGSFNTYIGQDAGIAVSGHENIEIVASGTNESFLGVEASGKMNIGSTIVADMYQGRVKVGSPADASPDATLEVRPDNAEEIGFLIRHVGSGGAEPYLALQSGDATTLFHINNSGDVVTSGYMNPSGGVLFNDLVPQDTTNRLYNDGGTLFWNGTQVDTAGGTNWSVANDSTTAGQTVTDSQVVTISGVSGVTIDQIGRFLQVSAGELSGVLQPQISNSLYTFDIAASGSDARNNQTETINQGDIVLLSGVSGVHVDFELRDDGGQRSGIFVLGYDPTVTYAFNAVASGNGGQNNTPKSMANDSVIAISGVSGINIDFENRSDGTNESGVFILGFTDEYWSKASGEFNNSQILENTQSGVAISGIATWASGEFSRLGIGGGSKGTSGIIFQDDHSILDPQGSGSLARLNLKDSSDSIVIQTQNGVSFIDDYSNSIFIGDEAGSGSTNQRGVVAIGRGAGKSVYSKTFPDLSDPVNNVYIGDYAGYLSSGTITNVDQSENIQNIMIGVGAGRSVEDAIGSVAIGYNAASGTEDFDNAVAIGRFTASGSENIDNSISIGYKALSQATSCSSAIAIGYGALETGGSSGGICIGRYAGYSASSNSTICIGTEAGFDSAHNGGVFIGFRAGKGQINNELYTVAIGYKAGEVGNTRDSVFLGYEAGAQCYGDRNLIIRTDAGDSSFDYSTKFSVSNRDDAIMIGQSMFGWQGTYFHIGENSVKHTTLDTDPYGRLQQSALNLTPHTTTQSALYLRPTSSQSSSLMKTRSNYSTLAFDTNIISKNGQLLVQVANSKSGGELLTAGGNFIPRNTAGQIALYETASNTGIAILVEDGGAKTWKYIELNPLP